MYELFQTIDEHGQKVETVRYSLFNLVGRDSTKSVYGTISSAKKRPLIYE